MRKGLQDEQGALLKGVNVMKERPVLLGFLVGGAVILIFFGVSMLVLPTFRGNGPRLFSGNGNGIGIIEIHSTIVESDWIVKQLAQYQEDDSIRGILVRIDSPGGAVGPSQEIYREILKVRKTKVVVASLGGTAASGGYYVASAATKIVANPGTLTGSIGVIMEFTNVRKLYEYAGVSSKVIKSGEFKDMGSWTRELTAKEKTLLQAVVDDVQSQFLLAIAEGRGMALEDILPIADGRIFTGAQALAYGLVDNLGNLNDAIDILSELAGIQGKPRLVRPKKRRISLWDIFFDEFFESAARHLGISRISGIPEFELR